MPSITVEAIVLRRRPLGEADKQLTLFSRETGKLAAIAKGARKPTSKLAGATETCVQARFQLVQGRTFWIITQAVLIHARAKLHRLLLNAAAAIYACELTDYLLEEGVPDEELYQLLSHTLNSLEESAEPLWTLCLFENAILNQQGYAPILHQCARCAEPLQGSKLLFHPEVGGMLCERCAQTASNGQRLSPETWHTWLRLQAGETIATPPPPVAQQLQMAVHHHLRYHLEREARSAVILWQIRQQLLGGE